MVLDSWICLKTPQYHSVSTRGLLMGDHEAEVYMYNYLCCASWSHFAMFIEWMPKWFKFLFQSPVLYRIIIAKKIFSDKSDKNGSFFFYYLLEVLL